MTLYAEVQEDGMLIAKAPKSLWGKKVKIMIQEAKRTRHGQYGRNLVPPGRRLGQHHQQECQEYGSHGLSIRSVHRERSESKKRPDGYRHAPAGRSLLGLYGDGTVCQG